MLTQKQRDLLYFIHDKMRKDDVPPSFEEMKEALGLKSKSGIHRLISALVERGFIERRAHCGCNWKRTRVQSPRYG